jgi:hypothetical protein
MTLLAFLGALSLSVLAFEFSRMPSACSAAIA